MTSTGRYGIYTDAVIIELEKQTASVGEEVTVTIVGTLALRAESELPDTDFKDVLFGACLERESDSTGGGYCGLGSTPEPLPDWIKVFPQADSHLKQLGTVKVKRGEWREETLTFSFTSTVPVQLEITPYFYADTRMSNYGTGNLGYTVTFVE